MTAGDVKFSDCDQLQTGGLALDFVRRCSASTSVSGSVVVGNGMVDSLRWRVVGRGCADPTVRSGFEGGDLVDAALMAAAFELGGGERGDDRFGEAGADHPAAHRQHVGVVVQASHAGRVEAVAQRSTNTADLVRSELFTLAAAAEHDAPVGVAGHDTAADAGADLGVVDRFGRMRALIVDLVAVLGEERRPGGP